MATCTPVIIQAAKQTNGNGICLAGDSRLVAVVWPSLRPVQQFVSHGAWFMSS
jgi:hypothetical protein